MLRYCNRFAWSLAIGSKPIHLAGVQRIYKNVAIEVKPYELLNSKMSIGSTGYTQTKLTQLRNHYYNPNTVDRAIEDLDWRIKNRKYGSGACDFRGRPKKNTRQDYCMTALHISYYPNLKGCHLDMYWRTTEVIKRFKGDIVFLTDFILPMFKEQLDIAPLQKIRFHFTNCTFHPMFALLLNNDSRNLVARWRQLKRYDHKLFMDCLQWAWRYTLDESCMIEKYSSAKQVKNIYYKLTSKKKQKVFEKLLLKEIKLNYDYLTPVMKEIYK